MVEVTLCLGRPGTGKTHHCLQLLSSRPYYAMSDGRWFPGYNSEEDILMDEFAGSWFELSYLLRLWNQAPMHVPFKGGNVAFFGKRFFVTSNRHPSRWYDYDKCSSPQEAVFRRITRVFLFTGNLGEFEEIPDVSQIYFGR